jgi:hypothetical protein
MVLGHDDREALSPDLVAWRARQLRRAGVPRRAARELAGDLRFDVHALLELIDRACPPALAVRIVAPLDREPPTW